MVFGPDEASNDYRDKMALLHRVVKSHPLVVQPIGGEDPRGKCDHQQDGCVGYIVLIEGETQLQVLQHSNSLHESHLK